MALNNKGEQISRSMETEGEILGMGGTMNKRIQYPWINVVERRESLRKLLIDGNISLFKSLHLISYQNKQLKKKEYKKDDQDFENSPSSLLTR